MEKHYYFAGVEVTASIPDDAMYEEERHLGAFRVEEITDPHRFEFEAVDEMVPPAGHFVANPPSVRIYRDGEKEIRYLGSISESWEKAYLQVESCGKEHRVHYLKSQFPEKIASRMLLNCMGAEHLIARAGGFIFHCSYIEREGEAILFTAPSGTGKSTQADLWREHRGVEIINGDRAAIRLVDGQLMAEGIPFAGSSQHCKNRSLPIRAIVYLAQAKENSIRRLRGYEAFSKIWEGVSVNTWDQKDMEMVSEAVQVVAKQVPVFYMPCTPDEEAVKTLEEALRKLEEQ